MSLIIVVLILFFFLLVGAPVIFAIGAAGFSYFLVAPGMWDSIGMYAHKYFTGMDSFVFLCIPLFILSGELMSQSGMMNNLVRLSRLMVGRVRGGLAYVNVIASMLFGGISGAAMADISSLGPVLTDMMKKDGYKPEFSAALVATSAIQGPIIPPSIPMVIFASVTNVSVGALFIGGAVPGALIGIGQIFIIWLLAKRKGFPKNEEKFSFNIIIRSILSGFWAMLMPIIILGGILSGVFTATEAAAVAVGYSFLVAILVYRSLTWKSFVQCLINTAKTTSSIYLVIAFSYVLGWIFAMERVPEMLAHLVEAWNLSPYAVLFLINIFLLFNGMWISDSVQILLFAPIFTPLVVGMGIHPIHFGVVMVVNVMIGLITPPYGVGLYLAASVGKTKLNALIKEALPFIGVSIAVLFLVTYVPQVVLFLPRLLHLIN